MSSVDNRVVEMRFNNQQFESGVRTTVKSLDDLKKGLDLDGAAKSLSNLERVGNRFSLAGIAAGVDTIASKFNALGVIGFTALQNITNSAINAGKRIVSALTIDPILTGFDEYETKMGAIQTILTNTASKGTTINDVNKALNELNEYSDQTIYNFAEMAKNIGTFTAAGVDLKTSVASIKGIANLAAGSGSTSLQASTAMYQLSQAIAAGSVKLMDWNSVVNAGMGGELFQKALEKTAAELGHGRDMAVSFRESLESGWITTEVLTKTLNKFANDKSLIKAATEVKTLTQLFNTMKESVQSGWAQSWEAIVGDKNEAAAFFTAINDGFGAVIGSSAKARNEMLAFWKANGGRAALIEGLSNAFMGLSSILEPIEKAFRDIFPALTGQRLVDLTKGFKDLMVNFKIGEATSENIKRTFRGLFALLDIGKQALFAIGNAFVSVLKYLFPVGDGLLGVTGNLGDFIVSIRDALKSSDAFNLILSKIGNVLKPVADGIKAVVGAIVETFTALTSTDTKGIDSFSDKVKTSFQPFIKVGEAVSRVFEKMFSVIKKVSPIFYNLASAVGNAFATISNGIIDALNNADFNSIFDMVNSGIFAAILLGLRKFIKSLTEITNNAGGFIGQFTGILDGVKGSLEAYQSQLKANVLLKIAFAIGILSAALVALSMIDSKKLTIALSAMTAMFIELFGSMAIFEKVMGAAGFVAMGKITLAMIGLSIAILILSSAVTKLAKLDWNGVAKGLAGVAGSALILVGAAKLLQNTSGGLIRSSIGFIVFGTALLILSSSVKKLGELDLASLAKGLISVGILAAELALFLKMTDLSGMGITKGVGLLLLATALNVLSTAVRKFSELDTGALIKGLSGVAVVLAEVGLFVTLTGDSKRVITTAIGLTILGASMLIFSKAISNMGSMSWESIGKGLLTMAGALTIIAVAIGLMPGNMILTGAGLVVIATSLLILSKSLENIGGMSWEGIAKGLIVLSGSLTIIAVAMAYMTTALPGAAALLIIAGALTILTPILKTLGSMSLADIGTGLLALAGVFTVIGLAAYVLAPLTPVIIGLGAAITLFGIGCAAVGAGVLAFSAALTALAVSGAAGAAALVVIITSIVGLIPMAAKTLAQGIIDFIKVIGDGVPTIAKAIKQIVVAIVEALVEITPVIVDGLFKLLDKILSTLIEYAPKLIDAGMKLIISLLEGISNNIGKLYATGIKIVVNYIRGIASMLPEVVDAGINLIISFINALADGIRNNTDKMILAMENLINAIIEAGLKALTAAVGGFKDVGVNLVKGLINGMKSMVTDVANAASNLGSSVLSSAKKALGIRSPSRLFAEIGKNIGAGLTKGIENSTQQVETASTNMSKTAVKSSKEVVKVSNDNAKKAFDTSVEWIDERKYYNQLSLKEELEAWERVQARYIAGSEERKKADREVYRVKKELLKADEEAAQKVLKDQFNNSINWIDDNKYYNRLGLTDELAAWKRVQKRYLEGTEERKKADREVYRVEQEINKTNEEYSKQVVEVQTQANEKRKDLEDDYYSKTKEINEKLKQDIKSLTDEYEQALKSRENALYNSYGLFDKVGDREQVNGQDLINNLQSQVDTFDAWQKKLQALSIKGLDQGLIQELQDMGPKSIAEIDALNRLTKPELDTYASLWREKHKSAKIQAVKELEGMRIETMNKITELQTQAETELDEYRKVWSTKMLALVEETDKQLSTLKTNWFDKIGSLRTETEQEFIDMIDNVQSEITKPDWSKLGADIIGGMLYGVKSNSMFLSKEIANTARKALQAAKDALGIKSPSKEFAKVGAYSIQGFINGLKDFSGNMISTARDVGTMTKNSLKNTLSNMSEILSGELDMTPTIRPVLDLSNVTSGGRQISSMFNNIKGIKTNELAIAVNTSRQNQNGINETTPVASSESSTVNSFSISNLIVREEADIQKIARQLYQLQVAGSRG